MLSNTQTDKLLDDCMNGIITSAQLTAQLSADSNEVADKLMNEHLVAVTAVQQYSLLKQVEQIHQLYAPAKAKTVVHPMFTLKRVMRIAAVFLLALSTWLFYEYSTNTYNRLYNDLFTAYSVNEVRGNESGQINALVDAYRSGQYSKSAALFATVENPTSRDLFFTAMSYLRLSKPADAVPLFNKIYAYNKLQGEGLYEDETDYYLALTWLKLNDKQKAIELFEKIKADKEHTYNKTIPSSVIFKIKWFAH